jgi:hypothetical protein
MSDIASSSGIVRATEPIEDDLPGGGEPDDTGF